MLHFLLLFGVVLFSEVKRAVFQQHTGRFESWSFCRRFSLEKEVLYFVVSLGEIFLIVGPLLLLFGCCVCSWRLSLRHV